MKDPVRLPRRFKPTQLLLAFFGEFVLDREDVDRVPARVIIEVLDHFGITEANVRVTLGRMVKSDLLASTRSGRTASYALTRHAIDVLRDGERRVRSADPFAHPEADWTLLHYSVPERRRDLRHQVRSRLAWLGFGPLGDGLWIAPGAVDVEVLLAELADDGVTAFAFAGRPTGWGSSTEIAATAWDLEALRAEHEAFIDRWSGGDDRCDAVATQVAMYADWLELLRRDPGLPRSVLPHDWPAEHSVRVFTEAAKARTAAAHAQFRHLIDGNMQRR